MVTIDDGFGGWGSGTIIGGRVPKASWVAILCAPSQLSIDNNSCSNMHHMKTNQFLILYFQQQLLMQNPSSIDCCKHWAFQ
jgi:hypothetical protein